MNKSRELQDLQSNVNIVKQKETVFIHATTQTSTTHEQFYLFYIPNSSYINQNVTRKCPTPTPPPSLNCSSSVLRSRRDHDRFWRDCFTHLPPPKMNSVLGRAQMSSSLQQLSPFFHIKIYEHCSNHLLFSLIQKKVAIKQAAYYVISVLRFLSDQKQPKIIYVDFSTPLLFMQN